MTFLRLLRSCQNKTPKLGLKGSNHHVLLRQQRHRGLIHPNPLHIPACSTLWHHFYSTTVTTPFDDTVLYSDSPQANTNDSFENEETDFWKNGISKIKLIGRTADQVWEDYTQLLEDPTVELNEFDYITVCVALKKDTTSTTSIKRMQTLLRHIHERGDIPKTFVRCCNMLIYVYLEHRDLASARLVFDGLLRSKYEPTVVTITTLLNGIGQLGSAKDALSLYKSLSRQGMFPNSIVAYQKLIKVLGINFGDVDTSMALFNKLKESSKHNDTTKSNNLPPPDIILYNTMLGIYRQSKQPERAWAFYRRWMDEDDSDVTPSMATYYNLLTALKVMKDGDNKTAWIKAVYDDMQALGLETKATHYHAMGWDALDAFNLLKRNGSQLSVNDYNILIASAVKNNKFEDALTLFQHLAKNGGDGDKAQVSPDVYTYGIVMDALVKDAEQSAATVFDMYEEMKQQGVKPDVVIFSCLLQACGRDGNTEKAVGFLEEMEQFNIRPNVYILNNFMGLLSQQPIKEKSNMYCARALWDQMLATGIDPDTRAFNHYLSLLTQFVPTVAPNEIKSARSLMQDNDLQQQHLDDLFDNNSSTSTGEIPMSGTAKYMMILYRRMRQSKNKYCHPDFVTYSIMINAMVTNGQTRQAMLLFRDAQSSQKMLGCNIYNSIMQGLLRENDLHQVMHMWQDMKVNSVLPDRTSYDLVLDACEQLHLAESFTVIMKQREADLGRLARLDDAREKRWSRSKSLKEHKKRQQWNLGDESSQHYSD